MRIYYWKKQFKSIRLQVILMAMIFSLAVALLAAGATYAISRRYLELSRRQSAQSTLQLVGREIDKDLQSILMFASWIQIDPTIGSYLQSATAASSSVVSRGSRQLTMTTWERLNDEFNSSEARNYVGRAVISVNNGTTYIQTVPGSNSYSNKDLTQKLKAAPFYAPLMKADDYAWIGLSDNPLNSHSQVKIIPILRPIESASSSRVLGWTYLELSTSMITDRLASVHTPDTAGLYITLGEGHSYQYRDGELLACEVPSDVMTYHLSAAPWDISMIPPEKEASSQQRYYIGIVVMIFLLIFLAGILLALFLRHVISIPVTSLTNKIRKVGEGDFSRDPSIEWDNELGDIGRGINTLSENVQAFMEKRVQDEKQKQELAYEILQSQINPHFMYNTLNTIKWMASIQGASGIADISTALSRLLKNISKGTEHLIPLKDEIALVNDYFTIMKYRYGGTISLDYRIDDESLLSSRVNRFSLQPIVENAIFHGIEPKGNAGMITIHVYRGDDNTLKIAVTDNGVGMDDEMIRKVLSGESKEANDFFRHVGVSNVNKRIRFSFGEQYGITITSRIGEFTTMLFTLPVRAAEDSQTQEEH